jgi:hypothetical protein
MVPVTPVMGDISPSSKLNPKHMGKAPGVLTQSGWTSLDVNNVKFRCHDYATAKLWCEDWVANTGFAVGDGYVVFDNDQGREFSLILRGLLSKAPRRFVQDPKHERDAFFVRVLDFVGDGASVPNIELTFRNGVRVAKLSILAKGKQSVIGGVHPGTRAPYVWDRDINDIADIPFMTDSMFDLTVVKFIKELGSRGWKLDGPPPRPVSGVSVAPATIRGTSSPVASSGQAPRFARARDLLALIPNRDIPSNITPSRADLWLDSYAGWIDTGYRLAAFLENDVLDPEAEEVFCEWSDGRVQIRQTSRDLWRSIRGQKLIYQANALNSKVQELTQGEPDFPDDLDPADPAMQFSKTPIWDKMRADWVYCATKGFVDTRGKRMRAVSKDGFSGEHAHLTTALKHELATKGRTVADVFLNQPGKTAVVDVTYAPGDQRLFFDNHPLPTYNAWRPTALAPAPVAAAQIQPWLAHLLFVLGSVPERDRFLRWCAFVVQHPKLKPNWHWLIMSLQGLGKDSMILPLKLAVGDDNHHDDLLYSLKGGFTDMLEYKLLILNEASQMPAGSPDANVIQALLKKITAAPPTHLKVNPKNIRPYLIPNRLAVLVFSNDDNPVHVQRGDRRLHVVDRQAQQPQTQDYYQTLYAWFDNGGAALAASYLLTYPLTDADKAELLGGVAPSTSDKAALEQMNLPPQQAALEALIDDAREGLKDNAPVELIATAHELAQMIHARGGLRQPTDNQIGHWLLGMERAKRGVRRYRVDPKHPETGCGVASASGYKSGRLWLLADKTVDGRDWERMPTAEVLALWLNMPAPKNATVTQFPSQAFPNDDIV